MRELGNPIGTPSEGWCTHAPPELSDPAITRTRFTDILIYVLIDLARCMWLESEEQRWVAKRSARDRGLLNLRSPGSKVIKYGHQVGRNYRYASDGKSTS